MKKLAVLVLLALAIAGCKTMPPVTLCYDSPKWGHICVTIGSGGDKTIVGTQKPLTAEELTAAQEWVKAQK